jgi:hypothetical protein
MNGGSISSQYISACTSIIFPTLYYPNFRSFRPEVLVKSRAGRAEPGVFCICHLYTGQVDLFSRLFREADPTAL